MALSEGELGPHLTQCGQAEAYLHAKFHLDPCNRLATGVRSLSVHDIFGTKGWTRSVHDDFGTYEINFGTCVFVV